MDANSKLYVNTHRGARSRTSSTRLQTVLEDKTEKTVYLKGDKDAPYGAIMKMMDALRKAQIDTVGLITEQPGGNSALGRGGQ